MEHLLPGPFCIFVSLQWSILQVLIFSSQQTSGELNICHQFTSASFSSCLLLFIPSSSICPPRLRPLPAPQVNQVHKRQERTQKAAEGAIRGDENQDPGISSPLIAQYFSSSPAPALSFYQSSWADAQTFTAHKISAGCVVSFWVTAETANISQPQIPARWFASAFLSLFPSCSPVTSLQVLVKTRWLATKTSLKYSEMIYYGNYRQKWQVNTEHGLFLIIMCSYRNISVKVTNQV